jgi:hypothetical protein
MLAVAAGSLLAGFASGSSDIVFPALQGLLAYAATRRRLGIRDTVLSVAGPPVAWISFVKLRPTGVEVPLDFRLTNWLFWTALCIVGALAGAVIGSRRRSLD